MIVVTAHLHSAISRSRDADLCKVHIINDGTSTSPAVGHYQIILFSRNGRRFRETRIEGWPREARPAWRLVAEAFRLLELPEART